MRLSKLFFAAAFALPFAAGCTAEAGTDADEAVAETGEEAQELRAADALVGAYSGVATGRGYGFAGLVLSNRDNKHTFFADVNTGIVCITAPCPTQVRIAGTYTAGPRNLTLTADDGAPHAQRFTGKFRYAVTRTGLSLTRGRETFGLEKEVSYCGAALDCREQNLITPRCLGTFECAANACAYRCGMPAKTLWLSYEPTQCGTNAWEQGAANSGDEKAAVVDYFASKGIAIEQLGFLHPTEPRMVCMACSCPRGDRLIVKAASETAAAELASAHGFARMFANASQPLVKGAVQCGGNAWNRAAGATEDAQLATYAGALGASETGFVSPAVPRMTCMACQCPRGDAAVVLPSDGTSQVRLGGQGFQPLK